MKGEYSIRKGYVFYERLLESAPNWKILYPRGIAELNSISLEKQGIQNDTIIIHLNKIAQQEKAKETRLLNQVLDIDVSALGLDVDYTEFVKAFNSIINLKNTLLTLINQVSAEQNAKDEETVIIKEWNNKIRAYITSTEITDLIQRGATTAVKQKIEAKGMTLLKEVISAKGNQQSISGYWVQLRDVLEQLEKFSIIIKSQALQKLGISTYFDQIYTQILYNQSTGGISPLLTLDWDQGKAFKDVIGEMFQKEIVVSMGKGGSTVSNISSNLSTQQTLFTGTFSVDIKEDNLATKKDLNKLVQSLRTYYNTYMTKLEPSLLVFESSSKLTINENFRGVKRGGKLEELPQALNEMGLESVSNDLVYKLYNTITGAIGVNYREEIREDLRLAISGCIANILFPDWESIGSSSSNAIHLFSINGKYIPLSYFLHSVAKALQNYERSKPITLSLKLPDEILFPSPQSGDVSPLWEQQRMDAQRKSSYQITFLKDFKSLLAAL